eukprot:CAMPEP_0116131344 /NCGR_PEP_ID=MMETSP0329-20121206/8956_1 /TAXON_ID=697910 /ORGANISM="Pseudo-nitzschia arenysensis, Strain B593" /LENGTH=370 /DNA_ID=CAMNT_0003625769 /DNA_START=170 /DNA_END=1282 /DNA_ORIENTATION=+
MAGMIYDANESLNWILGDPDVKEAFRNSSMVGSSIVGSMDFHNSGSAQLSRRTSTNSNNNSKNPSALEKKEKFATQGSSNSLSNLFSDEEERDLLGIGFFTIWEAGLLVSGYGGNGIVLSRNIMTGQWSGPVAVGVSGVGAGVLAGASMKTVVYLIYDYFTLKSIIGTDGGLIFGAGAGVTIGTWTKDTGKQSAYITSPKMLRTAGIGSNVALCRGLAGMYGAMSVEAGICKCRDRINNQFYGKENISGSDILLSGETIEIPNNTTGVSNYQAKRLLEKIHSKLERLCDRDGSNHGEKTYNHSNDEIGYNPDDSDNSDELKKEKPEDVRATLEKLYADESFDESHRDEEDEAQPVTAPPSEEASPVAANE